MATPHIWERLNNGYQTTQLYSVSISKDVSNPLILGGFQTTVISSIFRAILYKWTMPFNGMVPTPKLPIIMRIFYIQIQRGVLYKMQLDNNGTIQAFNRMDPADADTSDFQFINQLAWYLTMMKYSFPEGNTIWRQEAANSFPYNNDRNRIMDGWTELNPNFVGTDSLQNITAITATPSAQNKVYYGTDQENYIESIMLLSSIPSSGANR